MVSEIISDSTGRENSASLNTPLIVEWHQETVEAAASLGCDHTFAAQIPDALTAAGLVDVKITDRSIPLGGWKLHNQLISDNDMRKMDTLLCDMIRNGVSGLTRNTFVKGLGWSDEQSIKYAKRIA